LGFKGASTGGAAVARFHKSFLGACRLLVEVAKEIGEGGEAVEGGGSAGVGGGAEAPAAGRGRQPASDVTALANELGVGRLAASAAQGVKDKALLAEYLAATRSRASAPTWANDDALTRLSRSKGGALLGAAGGDVKVGGGGEVEEEEEGGGVSGDDEYQELPRSKGGAAPGKQAPVPTKEAEEDDMAFLRSKVVKNFEGENAGMGSRERGEGGGAAAEGGEGDGEEAAEQEVAGQEEQGGAGAAATASTAAARAVNLADSGRLFVRNLPFSATEGELMECFGRFGRVADVLLPKDGAGKAKGFGYVTFLVPSDAPGALKACDGKNFQGRLLHVLAANPVAGDRGEGEEGGPQPSSSSSYKQGKEEKRRAAAASGQEERGNVWNTLFIRSDTALAAAASSLGLSVGDVMERDASNLAVRAALAETRVIAETKQWLQDNGVSLEALEASAAADKAEGGGGAGAMPSHKRARSDACILVKNLPADVDVAVLRDLFSRYGALGRFILPPSKAMAIAEFSDPRQAKKAFCALSYARFQRAPLYLEWAPLGVFLAPKPAEGAPAPLNAVPAPGASASQPSSSSAPSSSPAAAADAAASSKAATTLFVKNLSFASTEEGLRSVFSSLGALRSVRIPRKRNPNYRPPAPGAPAVAGNEEFLSAGYGFVEFMRAEDADAARVARQGATLDGHPLELQLSRNSAGAQEGGGGGAAAPAAAAAGGGSAAAKRGKGAAAPPAPPAPPAAAAPSAKLMVRNLAFEATKKDLLDLFSPFGTVKTARLPRKHDGTGRGFAFIDFLTHVEAATAKEALGSTHLYGRKLVLEWAAAGEEGGVPAAAAAAAVVGASKRARVASAAPAEGAGSEQGLAQGLQRAAEKLKKKRSGGEYSE